jgi:hypothetical protein
MGLQSGVLDLSELEAQVAAVASGAAQEEEGGGGGGSAGAEELLGTEMMMLLSAANNPLLTDPLMHAVARGLLHHAARSRTRAAARGQGGEQGCGVRGIKEAAAGAGGREEARGVGKETERLVEEIVGCAEGMWLTTTLIDLAELLVDMHAQGQQGEEAGGHAAAAVYAETYAGILAQMLLHKLFRLHRHARPQVLTRLFAGPPHRCRWLCACACAWVLVGACVSACVLTECLHAWMHGEGLQAWRSMRRQEGRCECCCRLCACWCGGRWCA